MAKNPIKLPTTSTNLQYNQHDNESMDMDGQVGEIEKVGDGKQANDIFTK